LKSKILSENFSEKIISYLKTEFQNEFDEKTIDKVFNEFESLVSDKTF
jgi:hypothetical protein